MVAIEPGMALAHSVVPSSGSTAMSTLGPALRPTFSPMNSIGASSRSPSPITIVPSIGSLLSSRRIASTAAWSAAFSLPWPRSRAADTAGRSGTRTISSVRMRSSNNCGGTEICVDISALPQNPSTIPRCANGSAAASILVDPDHLRPARDHLVLLHGGQRAIHRVLMRGIGDQEHGYGRCLPRLCRLSAIGVTLHDGFDGDLLFG